MSLIEASTQRPPAQRTPPTDKSKPLRVTGKLKAALDLMVWDNKSDNQAAVTTGMHVLSIRKALNRAHVRAYVREQREVLRTRELGRNIHTLVAVRDQKRNQMARVQAVKALEQLDELREGSASRGQAPGFVIVVQQVAAPLMPHVRDSGAKPLIDHQPVGHRGQDGDD